MAKSIVSLPRVRICTGAKDTEKRQDNQPKTYRIMERTLLECLSIEKLDTLIDVLSEVMNEMKEAAPERDERYRDEAYVMCLQLSAAAFDLLREKALSGELNKNC